MGSRLLALDIGTKLGMCMALEGEVVEILTWHVKTKTTEDLPDHERWRRLYKLIEDRVSLYGITDLAFELVNHATIRGGRQAQLYWGAVSIVQLVAAQHGLKLHPIPVGTVKMTLAGKGNAKKDEMLTAARSKTKFSIVDDNSADALGVALCALKMLTADGETKNVDRIDRKSGSRKVGGRKAPSPRTQPKASSVCRSAQARTHPLGRSV